MDILVVPAQSKLVRDPTTMQHLPPEGRVVTDGQYWRRRAKDGDVRIMDPPRPQVQNAPAPARRSEEG